MKKALPWIIAAAVIIIAIIAIYYIVNANKTTPAPPYNPNSQPNPGSQIGDTLGGISGWINNLFAGKQCDPNNPGFQKNGTYNPDKCGTAPGFECDPNRTGYNMQGFPDVNCGFGG